MNEIQIRDYLLGRLSEKERETLESAALQQQETYESIRAVENDLFDDFATERLAAGDRQAFVKRYAANAERIGIARALSKRTTNVAAFPMPHQWMRWAVAAAIVVVVGGLMTDSILTIDSPARPSTPTFVLPHVHPPVSALLVPLALGSSRSTGTTPVVTIPKGTESVRFRVRLNTEDRFDSYSVDIAPSWHADQLKASEENGDLFVFADVPVSVFANGGKYELSVHANGEDLGFVMLEVHRTE